MKHKRVIYINLHHNGDIEKILLQIVRMLPQSAIIKTMKLDVLKLLHFILKLLKRKILKRNFNENFH